jgi:hypothetical protein
MGPNYLGKKVSFPKKSVGPTHQCQQPSIKKVIIARPRTSQQSNTGSSRVLTRGQAAARRSVPARGQ